MRHSNFLFILPILLTACSPVNSPANSGNGEITATVIINQEPIGFGEAPNSGEVNSDSFIPPSKENANIKLGVESPIPPELASTVKQYKEAMNAIKVEAAEICAVAVKDLIPVFKSNNLLGDQYRWTIVFEAGNYTCWSSTLSNGVMGQYPTYFHANNGKIRTLSKADGVGWERIEGGWMDFTDIYPIVVFENGYVNPNGETLSVIYDDITPFGQAVSAKENPIPKASMDNLIKAGYIWNGTRGILEDPNGEPFLTLKGDNWLATDGIEFATESYNPLSVNGVDDKGMPVYVVNSRVIKDKNSKEHTELYVEKTGEWRSTVGYEPGSTTEIDVMKYNPVTIEDVESGFLRELKLSQQYKWPDNVTTPQYYLAFVAGSRTGALELTIFSGLRGENSVEAYADRLAAGTGSTPILSPDMYRIQSPTDPNVWFPLGVALQKGPNGEDFVFTGAYGIRYMVVGDSGNTTLAYVGPGLRTTYLLGMDGNTCEGASLRDNYQVQANLVKDACLAFMPPGDPKWGRVSWDTILQGADFGTYWQSKPLDIGLLSSYQDDVIVAYNW
ncbi:MAG: hypothetical protein K8S20_01225 [Chloroflexi bacterium]|nr:hypothetical protein [Chloroflexota bacterium]